MKTFESSRSTQLQTPLTGLYNRRFFDDYFEKELNRSLRYSHHLALVVFDLHRFKEVNDRYGHPQGDILLQMAAATLRKSMRTSDYAFRIGGDEFALLLPQSGTEQAATMSRRLRAAYAATIEPLRLGVSLGLDYGLAVYPDDGEPTGDPDSRCRREVVSVEKRGAASSGGRSSSGRNTPCPNAGEASSSSHRTNLRSIGDS